MNICFFPCLAFHSHENFLSVSVENGDFFDSGIMDRLRQQLVKLTELTQMDINGHSNHATLTAVVSFMSSLLLFRSICCQFRLTCLAIRIFLFLPLTN